MLSSHLPLTLQLCTSRTERGGSAVNCLPEPWQLIQPRPLTTKRNYERNQRDTLELKSTITEMKTSLEELNSRCKWAEESANMKTGQSGEQKEKGWGKVSRTSKECGTALKTNIHTTGIPEERRKPTGLKEYSKIKGPRSPQIWWKNRKLHIWAQWISSRINSTDIHTSTRHKQTVERDKESWSSKREATQQKGPSEQPAGFSS